MFVSMSDPYSAAIACTIESVFILKLQRLCQSWC